jgi:prepilin-type N-terminal cleavage/methylation domain-containing protein
MRAHPLRMSKAPRGFTLIELMLAVAILGLIMVMLAGAFHEIAAGKVQGERRLGVDQTARAILWQMSNEIRGAVQTPLIASHVLLEGQARTRSGTPLDSITVSTLDPGHRPTLEDFGPEEVISYGSTPNPKNRGWSLLTRTRTSGLLSNTAGRNATSSTVLADNLLSLHMRYFDGHKWTESWDSQSLPPGRELPLAVSIDLVVSTPNGAPVALSTMVSVPMAFAQW